MLCAFFKRHFRRIRSLLPHKREPERTAVPVGHESPSGAFKPQTGLRSKCRVFSAARSQRFRRAGSTRKGLLAPFRPQRRSRSGKKLAAALNAFFSFLRFRVAARRPQTDSSRCCCPERPLRVKMCLERPAGRDKHKIKNKITAEYGQSEAEAVPNGSALPLAQKRQMRYTINTTTAPAFR